MKDLSSRPDVWKAIAANRWLRSVQLSTYELTDQEVATLCTSKYIRALDLYGKILVMPLSFISPSSPLCLRCPTLIC